MHHAIAYVNNTQTQKNHTADNYYRNHRRLNRGRDHRDRRDHRDHRDRDQIRARALNYSTVYCQDLKTIGNGLK